MPRIHPAASGRDMACLRRRYDNGFSLLVTILLTSLLTVLGVAMLSLSSITLKSASDNAPKRIAQANARLALALALGELQTELGDDRRVTADSDIISDSVARPNMVGVWDSVAPTEQLGNPQANAPDYTGWKSQKFRKWLVSSANIEDTRHREYPLSAGGKRSRSIFTKAQDGFDLQADLVKIRDNQPIHGAMAWAVSQEGTRARMNLGVDPGTRLAINDAIQAPAGPYVGMSGKMEQPTSGWTERRSRVLDTKQAALDPGYGISSSKPQGLSGDFTTTSQGVLADVVKGGLKTDLSLGFDLDDTQFRKPRLEEVKNPFAANPIASGETPLYKPLNTGGPIAINVSYPPILYTHKMETGSVPTFQSLRSYYSLYRHLYSSGGQKTAFAREQASTYWPNSAPRGSETSVSPVMDRIMFFLSVAVGEDNIANLVVTPVITLWNPYNVAIDTDGYLIYPWMDFPINIQWTVRDTLGAPVATAHSWLSTFVGSGDTGEGRSTKPYFFCQITANGDGTTGTPIHLNPGEVRVFTPVEAQPLLFKRTGEEKDRTIKMRPVQKMEDFHVNGGLTIPMNASMWQDNDNLNYALKDTDRIEAIFQFTRDQHNYFVTMEDATRIRDPQATSGRVISEVQVMPGKLSAQSFATPSYPRDQLKTTSQPLGVLETYHRSAGQTGQLSDIVLTSNPRQRYVNNMVSASNFAAGPQYEASMRQIATVIGAGLQVTPDGRRAYFGYNNSADQGRDYLSFFDLPDEPMISLGGFQSADLSDSAFGPASQFGNSWAPAYLPRNYAGRLVRRAPGGSPSPVIQPYGENIGPNLQGLGIYDHSWLLNTALWDGFFFSSIAADSQLREKQGSADVYNSNQDSIRKSVGEVFSSWVKGEGSLRNPRMLLHRSGLSDEELQSDILSPAGCRKIAAHLMVDGAFNVNSTREGAWEAMLASLRGQAIKLQGRTRPLSDVGQNTPFPRLLNPTGGAGDAWDGFRTLTDKQIKALAKEIVAEIRTRGPAQSLGEFVNRRLSNDALGLKGTLQTAIDRAGLNDTAKLQKFDTSKFPYPANLSEPYTGVGTPGWLTQADLLNALGPVMTVRSDTFTIRTYGEARDESGKLLASAWYEAVVQRVPEWLETADSPVSAPEDVSPASARFGRRFEIRSFRELSREDLND